MRKCPNCGTRQNATNGPKCCNHTGREVTFPMDFPPDPIAPLQAEIARLTAERDTALAQVAAAAMEMREWAAGVCAHHLTDEADMLLADMWAEYVRALPIDPDAHNALYKMLAKARGEAIREVLERLRHEDDVNPSQTYDDAIEWVEYILALLNDGGQP